MKKRLVKVFMFPLYSIGFIFYSGFGYIIGIFVYIVKGINPIDYIEERLEYFIRKMEGK